MDENIEQVVKGGVCWFEFGLKRGLKGLEVSVKTLPEVEAFVKSLGDGKFDPVEAYGRSWYPLGHPLNVYRLETDVQSAGFTLLNVTEGFKIYKTNKINLSFLRLVGIGSPAGVRFGTEGVHSRQFLKDIGVSIVNETRSLIHDYITPVHVNLRISSQHI